MFASVSIWGILLAAVSAMALGVIWYSPFVFGKTWSKGMGVSDKEMNENRAKVMPILVVGSLITAYALSLLTVYLHSYTGGSWVKAGIEAGLLVLSVLPAQH